MAYKEGEIWANPEGKKIIFKDGRWQDFQSPVLPPAPPAAEGPSVLEDVGNTVPSGLVRGTASAFALPRMVGDLGKAGAGWLGEQIAGESGRKAGEFVATKAGRTLMPTGIIRDIAETTDKLFPSLKVKEKLSPALEQLTLPDYKTTLKATRRAVGVPDSTELYEPKTMPGRFVNAIAEAAPATFAGPGSAALKAVQGVGSAVGSQAAREAIPESAPGWLKAGGEVAGGLLGASAPQMTRKFVTPNPVNAENAALLAASDRLNKRGIQTLSSQALGKPGRVEGELVSGLSLDSKHYPLSPEGQIKAFSREAAKEAGFSSMPDRRALKIRREELGKDLDYITRSTDIVDFSNRETSKILNDINDRARHYIGQAKDSDAKTSVSSALDEIWRSAEKDVNILKELTKPPSKRTASFTGGVTGWHAEAMRERWNQRAASLFEAGNNTEGALFKKLVNVLDNAVEKAVAKTHPDDIGRFKQLRQQYRAARNLEKVIETSPDDVAGSGMINPQKLFKEIDDPSSPLGMLAHDASLVLKPKPVGESKIGKSLSVLPGLAGLAVGHSVDGPIGAAIGAGVAGTGGLYTNSGRWFLNNPITRSIALNPKRQAARRNQKWMPPSKEDIAAGKAVSGPADLQLILRQLLSNQVEHTQQ